MVTPLYEVELVYQPKSLDVLVGKENGAVFLLSCLHTLCTTIM